MIGTGCSRKGHATMATLGRPAPRTAVASPISPCRTVDLVFVAVRLTSKAAQCTNGDPTQSVAQKQRNLVDIAEGVVGGTLCTRSLPTSLRGRAIGWVAMSMTGAGCSSVGPTHAITLGRPVPRIAGALATPISLCRMVDNVFAALRLTSEKAQSMNGGATHSVARQRRSSVDIAEGVGGGTLCTRSLRLLMGVKIGWVAMPMTGPISCSTTDRTISGTPGRLVPTIAEALATPISL